uniref:Uncharacterized protein n=1 Tax=Oryza punctata TaxID=4537 RepID=A0A0E0K6Z6_ORYPU
MEMLCSMMITTLVVRRLDVWMRLKCGRVTGTRLWSSKNGKQESLRALYGRIYHEGGGSRDLTTVPGTMETPLSPP